jgi:hypothetical protein
MFHSNDLAVEAEWYEEVSSVLAGKYIKSFQYESV